MRVLIFEPDHRGHRLQYVRVLAAGVADLGVDVIVAVGIDAMGSDEGRTHLSALPASVRVISTPPSLRGSNLRIALTKVSMLRRAVRETRPDHILVPYADGLAQILGCLRTSGVRAAPQSIEIEGLLMHGSFAYPPTGLRRMVAARITQAATRAAPFSRVYYLDPIPFEAIQQRGGSFARRSVLMPEPVERAEVSSRSAARRKLGVPEEGRYLCCSGVLDERKGVDLLIPGVRRERPLPDRSAVADG